jgi:CheY-like chemotaxis protein
MAAKKILVADDSLTIQKVIRLALSNEGYEIHAVSDGKDALEQISVLRPHAVLIDVSLPGQSAFEVKRAVNGHDDLSGVKFILMSSAFESVDEAQADEVKFEGRLTKPFDPAHLRQILSKVFEGLDTASDGKPAAAVPPPPASRPSASPPPPPMQRSAPKGPPAAPPVPKKPPNLPPIELTPPDENEFVASESDFPPPVPADAQADELTDLPKSPGFASDRTDTEIQRLTESTIRMSGLDEFEWSIQEPNLKPPTNLLDSNESASASPAHGDESSDDDFPPYTPPDLSDGESGGTGSLSDDAPSSASYFNAPDEDVPVRRASLGMPKLPSSLNLQSVEAEEMEEIIRKQVEKSLEKIAREVLPELAERVIKAEIHRMLSERP